MTTFTASFPSPSQGVWHLWWLPIRAYALCIIVGIIVALLIGDRRWIARGGEPGVIYDIALWAVPFGLVGGRLYHVMTDWKTYFGDEGAGFIAALKIWDGGLGIWGAVALGGVGAWLGCRRRGIPLPAFGDAIAPGIILAQAIGRLGNYFNQELYGRETTMPWGMKIYERRDPSGMIDYLNGVSTGHVEKIVEPTFLYELIWNVLVFVLLIYADRRLKLGHGRLFALYVASYCVGRFWVELLRDDTATHIAGIRINSFTSVFVFIGAVVYIILAPKGREDPATLVGKPRKPKEPQPRPAEAKEEVPQEVKSGEDSALVAWTKELAVVGAAGGVVAGVAVAEAHDEKDKASGDGDTAEPAEPEEAESAEASQEDQEDVAEPEESPKPEAEALEAGEPDAEAEETPEADAEAEEAAEPAAEETPEAEAEAEAAEAPEPEAEAEEAAEPEAEDAPQPEAEAEVAEPEVEGEAEEAAEPQPEETPEPLAEEDAPEAETAESEVPTAQVTEESIAKLEPVEEEREQPAEPDESAGEAKTAEGQAPESMDTQERADQDETGSAEATRDGETGNTHAPEATDDLSEDPGAARRRWRLPRFRIRAK